MSIRHALAAMLFAVSAPVALSACADRSPFVYQAAEFNRQRVGFGHDVIDRKEAVICYARSATTPDAVRALAEQTCRQVGKRAVFRGQETSNCPLATPAAAAFDCVAP